MSHKQCYAKREIMKSEISRLTSEVAALKADKKDMITEWLSEKSELLAQLAAEKAAREKAEAELKHEREQLMVMSFRAEKAEAACAEMRNQPPEPSSGRTYAPCGHHNYWTGQYGTCMVCRANEAEGEVARLRNELEDARKVNDGKEEG